ncbi:hypothetical protein VKT23_020099 [Stygiomarasmius scandens]|uniref:Uncharacterized protein n=1 Tax=Marasmiellus scandens TaxID=2682957 RepID=A0ABR1INF6_9AGAR
MKKEKVACSESTGTEKSLKRKLDDESTIVRAQLQAQKEDPRLYSKETAPLSRTRTQPDIFPSSSTCPERTFSNSSLVSNASFTSLAPTEIEVDWDDPGEAKAELVRQGIKIVDYICHGTYYHSSSFGQNDKGKQKAVDVKPAPILFDPYSALGQYEYYLSRNVNSDTGLRRTFPIPPFIIWQLFSPSLRFLEESEKEKERWLDIDRVAYQKFQLNRRKRSLQERGEEEVKVVIPYYRLPWVLDAMGLLPESTSSSACTSTSASPSPSTSTSPDVDTPTSPPSSPPLPPVPPNSPIERPPPLKPDVLRTNSGWIIPTLEQRQALCKITSLDPQFMTVWRNRMRNAAALASVVSGGRSIATPLLFGSNLGLGSGASVSSFGRQASLVGGISSQETISERSLGKRSSADVEGFEKNNDDDDSEHGKPKKRRVEEG